MAHRRCLVLFGAVIALAGCSESGGSGGAASTAAGSTAAPTASSPSRSARTADAVSVPAGLQRGDVAIAYKLIDPQAGPGDVTVDYSLDGGATWHTATSSSPVTALPTGPSPGVDHALVWNSAADVSAFASGALVRVSLAQGGSAVSAPFFLDDEPVSTHVLLNRRPYLQSTTSSESLVLWRTETSTDSVVEYGSTPALGQTASGAVGTKHHEVRLTGLAPGQRTYYRIVSSGQPLTRRLSFETAPLAGSGQDVTLLVVGDSGMGNPVQKQIADLMAKEEADLFLNTGDVVYPIGGLGAAVSEYNARFFGPYAEILEDTPAFPVVGNHDLYGLLGQPFKETFVLPDNGHGAALSELYYSYEWADCTFIALESNIIHKSPVGPHIAWLNDVLARTTSKWVIVYMHTPLYSAGKHGDNRWLQLTLGPVLEHGGVDLVLAGHDHNYERTVPIKAYNQDPAYPGLVHVITGGGGADLRPVNATPRTQVVVESHHYLKVRISGDWLYGTAIDQTGQVIDSFALQNQ